MTSKSRSSTKAVDTATAGLSPADVLAPDLVSKNTAPLHRRRADAVQNRGKLLDAAEYVFLNSGINVSLDVIAEHAGVARTTLFRNFADRHALFAGLLDRFVEDIEREAMRIDGDPGALWRVLRCIVGRVLAGGPLNAYWRTLGRDSPEIRAAVPRFLAALEKPVAWAVADRACRRTFTAQDFLLLISMFDSVLYSPSPEEQALQADRAWEFIVELAQLRDMGA